MKIEFKEIDRTNYEECISLEVDKAQGDFVAPNWYSLVQATYEPRMYPLGIYKDNKLVGFILYDFDYELNGWSMSRFMIDKNYQNQGIGVVALEKFIELFTSMYGAKKLYTSAEVTNPIAIALYQKFGFKKTNISEYEHKGKTYVEQGMVLEL